MTRFLFVVAALCGVASAQAGEEKPESKSESNPPVALAAELAKKARASLVTIEPAGRDGEVAGVGTGFVISKDGLIATNMHVIGEARALKVELPEGRKLEVTGIHAWDRDKDLAVIRVDASDLTPLTLGDSSTLQQGDYVAAMGNPLGLRYSVVEGVVSAFQEVEGTRMVQLAMPIERGNSGGPLLDREGRVAGVVSLKSAVTANLGFAMPVNELRTLLNHPAPVTMKNWMTIGALNEKVWKTSGGRWTQRAGVIRARDYNQGAFGGRALCFYQSEPPPLPYELSVRVKLDDEAGAAGLMFCSDGGDTHYGFYPSGGGLRLTRFEGPDVNSWTILEQVQSTAYHEGDWNLLRVRIEKDQIRCFVNGQPVITSKDTALRSGRAGLCKFRDTEPDFKDFHVSRDPAPGDPVAEAVGALMAAAARGETLSPEAQATLAAYPDSTLSIAEHEAALLEKRAAELRRQGAGAFVQGIGKQLAALLSAKEPQDSDLARAAFLLARMDNPEFDPAQGMADIDRMAAELKASLTDDDKSSPEKTLKALHRWMFQENGFHGSVEDTNNRSNSYLNEVIDDREGLPITLCLLHRELARRLGLDVTGRNFPERFMNHFTLPGNPPREIYIDAFERGKILSAEEVSTLVKLDDEPAGTDPWKPASNTEVVLRMLNNLTANALAARDDARIVRYMDVYLAISPDSAPHHLQRLLILAKTGQMVRARADADWLVEKKPPGIDIERVLELVETLK